MGKKTLSKPMKEILSRLNEFEYIETMIFPEDIIVNVSEFLLLRLLKSVQNQKDVLHNFRLINFSVLFS